jgi:hypothetical protein
VIENEGQGEDLSLTTIDVDEGPPERVVAAGYSRYNNM